MKRNIRLEEISDGKLYDINDMVRADCNDCKGCSACCTGMGKSIILTPYDLYLLKKKIDMGFQQLFAKHIELNVVDGIVLPNLRMDSIHDRCTFLDENGRCSIHSARPGMCRLFPLGRYYENGSFKYFLQIYECKNKNRSKIKIKKWLDMENVQEHEHYINEWHDFLTDMEAGIQSGDEELSREINVLILNTFFVKEYEEDFYEDFNRRMEMVRKSLQSK